MTFLPYQFGSNPAADAIIKSMESRIHQLESALQNAPARYLKLLRVIEWSAVVTNERGHQRAACPYCWGRMDLNGHRKDCELIALLADSQIAPTISDKCSELCSGQNQNADKQDAERYRWLRIQHEVKESVEFDAEGIPMVSEDECQRVVVFMPDPNGNLSLIPIGCIPGELDAAIDAMREGGDA